MAGFRTKKLEKLFMIAYHNSIIRQIIIGLRKSNIVIDNYLVYTR